jgi:hypothetical protein
MRARAFITQKEAESVADCQDRFSINPATGSVAVSDGMSQSRFPKFWAEILADRYTAERDWFPTRENVQALAPFWTEKVRKRLEEWRALGREPWRSENMLATGASAGATLVGLRLEDGGKWTCNVLGDSCLVELEGDHIKEIYSSMDHFDNYPDYFDSNPEKPGKGEVRTVEGEWNLPEEPKKTLLLVTDALGAFLASIKGKPEESLRTQELLSVESVDEFNILVQYWRKDGMHNDDTTMVVVTDDRYDEAFKRQEEWVW